MSEASFRKQPLMRRLLFLFIGVCVVGICWFATFYLQESVGCWRIRRLLADSRLSPALEMATQLAERWPDCSECQFLLAKSARRSAQFSVAATALKRAQDGGWDSSQIQREQILTTAQSGQVRAVERELKQIFGSDLREPEVAEVYEALAYGHLAAFDAPEFLQSLHFWLEWRPDATQPRLLRAEFLARIQQFSEAVEEYKALLQIHPDCIEARIGLGENLLELNQAKEAADHLKVSFEQIPVDRTALLLAKSLVEIESPEEAKVLLLRFKDTPNTAIRAQILEELGRWHSDRDEPETAVAYLEESVRLAPESTSAWHSLASVYSMLGKSDEALKAQDLSRITRDRCQRLFNVVTEISAKPDSTSLRLEAASILFDQGMDKDAVAWLRSVLSIDLHHQEANRLLAKYYHASGQRKLELEHLKLGGLE